MNENLIVGIDISKKDFNAASRVGEEEVELGKFMNDEEGFAGVAKAAKMECARHGMSQIQLILESTGGYEAALKVYAYEQGWVLSMPNPHRVRQWAIGVGYRVKTDRIDARILAHYGVALHPPLRPQLSEEVEHLDSLLKRRQDLEQALHKEKNRLSEMGERPGMAPAVVESFRQVIAALETALAEIEVTIDELCQTHEPFQLNMKRLLALPGVGHKVVLPLLGKLFQFQNMAGNDADPNGVVAFIGFDPQTFESGSSVRKRAGISKMGDSELRRLLYMGALGGVKGNNSLKYFYQRLVGRGKAKKVALVAAARKILVWAWTIFSRQIDWDPNFNKIGA